MLNTWRAISRIKKRVGRFGWLAMTTSEERQAVETEKFAMLCEQADKRKLWALITGWDKVTNKPAVWKDGELI